MEIQNMSGFINDEVAELDYPPIEKILAVHNSDSRVDFSEIEINVIDSFSGKPIPNALISLDTVSRTGRSDEYGRARFSRLPKGRHPLDVIVSGYIAGYLVTECTLDNHRIQVLMERNCQLI